MISMWMVRAGEHGRLLEDFEKNNVVAIGWQKIGDLSNVKSPEEVRRMVDAAYGEESQGWKAISASQLSRFRFDFKENDNVVTYDPEKRMYLVGTIRGPYSYDSGRKEYSHVRKVEWKGQVSRDALSTPSRNTLGAISTIFDTGEDTEKEMLGLLAKGKDQEVLVTEELLEEVVENESEKARELVKDKVLTLRWDDVQRLVAGILQAMGYKARISPPGADRGKDVEASPDGLGLTEPRIVVEVKHRSGQTGVHDVKSFIAGLRQGHKGLYVSTGGFTKESKYEADRANVPTTLIDLDGLVDLVMQYYDNFDADTRHLLPLTKIYWPT